LQEFNYRSFE